MTTAIAELDRNILAQMRDWLADCTWQDVDADDFCTMPDSAILHGVDVHYAGGVEQFVLDS